MKLAALFVTPYMTTGGTEKVVFDLATGLQARGANICVASSGGPRADALRGLGVTTVEIPQLAGKSLFALIGSGWQLRRAIRAGHYQVINTHAFYSAVATWLALLGSRRRIAHIFSLHIPEKQWYYTLMGWTLNWMVDGVVTVCAETRDALLTSGVRPDHVKVIFNGVDVLHFLAHVSGNENEPAQPVRIVTVARLVPRKAHAVLFRAVKQILDDSQNIDLHLHVVGDGPMRSTLIELARELGIDSRVTFYGDRSDISTLLGTMDIFVLPSEREGLPLTLLEAMSCGLPIVATRVNGVPELVEEGVTGFLVAPNDSDALAGAMTKLLRDSQMRKAFGSAGRHRVERLFSIDAMLDSYEATFRSSANDGGSQIYRTSAQ